jgi:hypothetical protein
VLFDNPLAAKEAEVSPLWSATVEENVELVESCIRYEAAPVEAFQLRAGFVATPVAPVTGDARTGAAGATGVAASVVKLDALDQPLVPALLVALTRQ